MKCLLFALFLINTYNTLLPMHQITLPPKKEIYERLYNLGWKHFLKKTKIHKHLGFKYEYPGRIVRYIKSTIQNYNKNYATSPSCNYKLYSTVSLTQRDQITIITTLFKNHPQIIAFLEENDAFK